MVYFEQKMIMNLKYYILSPLHISFALSTNCILNFYSKETLTLFFISRVSLSTTITPSVLNLILI
jgi:hypothetical protein